MIFFFFNLSFVFFFFWNLEIIKEEEICCKLYSMNFFCKNVKFYTNL